MPPENELKYRVDFIYDTDSVIEKDQDKYWKRVGKQWYGEINRVINRRRAMERAVAQIVQPGDAPEAKLRRIYARVQQIRNVSFEPARDRGGNRAGEAGQHRRRRGRVESRLWRRDADHLVVPGAGACGRLPGGSRVRILARQLFLRPAGDELAAARHQCRAGQARWQGFVPGSGHAVHAVRHAALARDRREGAAARQGRRQLGVDAVAAGH